MSWSVTRQLCTGTLLGVAAVGVLTPPVCTAQHRLELERMVRVGADIGPSEYTFGFVADVRLGPDGHIWVLDTQNAQVRVFSLDGRHVRSFGGKGAGPGELQMPSRIVLSPDRVAVSDPAQSRVVVYSSSGRHIDTRRIHPPVRLETFIPMRDGLWLGARTTLTSAGVERLMRLPAADFARAAPAYRLANHTVVGSFREDTGSLDTLFTFDHGRIQYFWDGGYGFVRSFHAPGGAWATSGDSLIAFVNTYTGAVQYLTATSSGWVRILSGRIPVTPVRLAERDWVAIARDDGVPPRAGMRLTGPPYQPTIGTLVIARDGSLWIQRLMTSSPGRRSEREQHYLVVPMDRRRPQRAVVLPEGFRLADVYDDLLAGIRITAFGAATVEVWKVRQ